MSKRTLGEGNRAKNGQHRRRSRFHPCASCGLGTTFIYCVSCKGRVLAQRAKAEGVKVVANVPENMTEEQATEWLQMSFFK